MNKNNSITIQIKHKFHLKLLMNLKETHIIIIKDKRSHIFIISIIICE